LGCSEESRDSFSQCPTDGARPLLWQADGLRFVRLTWSTDCRNRCTNRDTERAEAYERIDFTAPEFDVNGLVGSGERLQWGECETRQHLLDRIWRMADTEWYDYLNNTNNSCEGREP
jgi:hypothetical protein